jgi:toxin ParE1/3/4
LIDSAVPTVEWRPDAIADFLAIIDYIADENPDAAHALNDDIARRIAKLPAHPRAYRIGRVAGTREMVVRRNYIVVYAEDAQTITIVRILHAAQIWP